MRSLQSWFDEYGESHRHPTNVAIHWVCVPLIMFASLSIVSLIATIALRLRERQQPGGGHLRSAGCQRSGGR